MTQKVLIIGGRGRIGSSIAQDLSRHTNAEITVTGRKASSEGEFPYLPLDLTDKEVLRRAIAPQDLIIHCAGPFHYRNAEVLRICIEQGVNYTDVSDHRSFHQKAIAYKSQAEAAGVTAILHTGVFPGISNSMVRQGIEQLDRAEKIHLSYVVGGSGGAGLTVMRTTFLGLKRPFKAWIDGKWQEVLPYSDRETVQFPSPYGKVGVYWFDMPETYTLPQIFPVQSVVTKFASSPDFYNHLTRLAAHRFPKVLLEHPTSIEFLSRTSLSMTKITNPFSGIGVAVRTEISGVKNDCPTRICLTFNHRNTTVATGYGTGSIAQLMLAGQLQKPGVWSVEEVVPTDLFTQAMESRGVAIAQQILRDETNGN